MQSDKKISLKQLRGTALVAAVFGAIGLFYSLSAGVPPLAALSSSSGSLYSFEEVRTGSRNSNKTPRFRLRGNDYLFQYVSKGGNIGGVSRALRGASGKSVEVYFDEANPFSPPFKDIELYTVYALSIEGKSIREYDEVAASWRSDNNIGVYLSSFFTLAGLSIGIVSFRRSKTAF